MTVNGRALTSVSVGLLFVWSGIKGWSMLGTLTDIVLGKKPTQESIAPLVNVSTSDSQSGQSGFGVSSNAIAATAMQYQGHAYSYGGAPGPDGSRPWDCSSFVNFIMAVKLRMAIPGNAVGVYNGNSHGPTTGMWGIWNGLSHVERAAVQAGDIIVWTDHMGIAISNSQMISALNEQQGTKVTPIEGYGNGPILCYGRYK